MRRSHLFLAAWLLLLVPTLVVGWIALGAVRTEGEQLAASERAAATERAASIATSVDLSVAEVRRGLLEVLEGLAAGGASAERLERWRLSNPLVRNVFLWHPDGRLLFPPESWPRGAEDRAFAERYRPLFDGRAGWEPTPIADPVEPGPSKVHGSSLSSGRQELRQLALQEARPFADSAKGREVQAPAPSGWVPWYAENRVHFLGWAEQSGTGIRYGLELEMMALLSRLLPGFPVPRSMGESYALLDGSGRVFHRTGQEPAPGDARASVPVGPELPHWQVAVSWPPAGTGGGVALLSTLLVGSFVAAILLGGSLLLWQARLQWADARRKTSFVANVSHELKTPLTTIRMYAELLAEGRVSDPAKRDSYLDTIVSESQRLTRLVNNVLEFGRMEQGRKRYHPVSLDLAAVVRQVLDGLGPRLRETGMQLRCEDLPERAPARSDRDSLEQILLNMLDNSLKYASEGEDITVRINRSGAYWGVHVGDRGPGIPAAHRSRVFDTFHRVDDSLTAERAGSGLGLSIARQLARDLGGDLACREREGGGTWFDLTVPADGEVQP